jgi:ribosome-associated protein
VTASRIEAVLEIDDSATLTDEQKRRLRGRFGARVTAIAQDARSQARNRELALERLAERVEQGLRTRRRRKATKPGRAARERRMESKRRRGELKRQRRSPPLD